MQHVFIIAEAGVNHNGDLNRAYQLVDAAHDAGADAVKFQCYRAENLVTKSYPRAPYQINLMNHIQETQFQMLKRLELSQNDFIKLSDYCNQKNILFLASPFDLDSITFLQNLGMKIFKIPSGEITNRPYLEKIGSLNLPILLSTGMASLAEIEEALEVLMSSGTPKEKMTVLHCNTQYPTPMEDVNLYAMHTIKNAFGVEVGYSDHTMGIEIAIAAAALGATVIEKHLTLNKTLPGPDHKASLEPNELKRMVQSIRNLEKACGDGIKRVSPSESENRTAARKSIVASRFIKKGEILHAGNMTVKRPGIGISPMKWHDIVKQIAIMDFEEDDLICF